MKLKPLGANRTELTLPSGNVVFFSYQTPVAARTPAGWVRTDQRYSMTTSRHVNQWLQGANAKTVPQAEIDAIAGSAA